MNLTKTTAAPNPPPYLEPVADFKQPPPQPQPQVQPMQPPMPAFTPAPQQMVYAPPQQPVAYAPQPMPAPQQFFQPTTGVVMPPNPYMSGEPTLSGPSWAMPVHSGTLMPVHMPVTSAPSRSSHLIKPEHPNAPDIPL